MMTEVEIFMRKDDDGGGDFYRKDDDGGEAYFVKGIAFYGKVML